MSAVQRFVSLLLVLMTGPVQAQGPNEGGSNCRGRHDGHAFRKGRPLACDSRSALGIGLGHPGAGPPPVAARPSGWVWRGWVGGGVGIGSYGLAGQISLALQWGANASTIRHAGTTTLFADIKGTGLLYGRVGEGGFAGAGVALVRENRLHPLNEPGPGPEVSPTLGVALQVQWRVGGPWRLDVRDLRTPIRRRPSGWR